MHKHTGTRTRFPMGTQPSRCPVLRPGPPQLQLSQETWMGWGLGNWPETGDLQGRREEEKSSCGQSLRFLLISAGQVSPVPPEPRAGASRNQRWERKGSQAEVREGRERHQKAERERHQKAETPRLSRASWRREVVMESCRCEGHRRGAEGRRLVIPVPAKPSAQQGQSSGLHTPE